MGLNLPKVEIDGLKACIDEVHLTGIAAGNMIGVVSFVVKDSDGKVYPEMTKQIKLEGAELNEFYEKWESPVAARAIYAMLQPGVDPASLPVELEDEFKSKVEVVTPTPEPEHVSIETVASLAESEPDREINLVKADGTSLLVKLSAALAALASAGAGAIFILTRRYAWKNKN
jgi:hypothetical protein